MDDQPTSVRRAEPAQEPGWPEAVDRFAGLIAIAVGLFVLLTIAVVAMALVRGDTQSVVAVVTGAFGVIGSIVGAYFGVRVGAGQRRESEAAAKAEAAKAQAFALHVPEERVGDAMAAARSMVATAMAPSDDSGQS